MRSDVRRRSVVVTVGYDFESRAPRSGIHADFFQVTEEGKQRSANVNNN
jgi:hypothetical protein